MCVYFYFSLSYIYIYVYVYICTYLHSDAVSRMSDMDARGEGKGGGDTCDRPVTYTILILLGMTGCAASRNSDMAGFAI